MSKKAIWVWALLIGFSVGGVGGFLLGAATSKLGGEMLKDAMSSEQIADLENPTSISRTHFAVSFPGNWEEDRQMEFYEPEYFFSLETPGGSYALLQVYDEPSDPAENLKAHEKEQSVGVKKITRKPFSKWGRYTGKGIELKGKGMGFYPQRIRIFSYSSETKSFIVIEQHYDEDEPKTTPGFDLIEKTFQLKGA